jgi:hypothetical protein
MFGLGMGWFNEQWVRNHGQVPFLYRWKPGSALVFSPGNAEVSDCPQDLAIWVPVLESCSQGATSSCQALIDEPLLGQVMQPGLGHDFPVSHKEYIQRSDNAFASVTDEEFLSGSWRARKTVGWAARGMLLTDVLGSLGTVVSNLSGVALRRCVK